MSHELPRLVARRREPQPEHHVVEPALEEHEEVRARDALHAVGPLEVAPELLLEQPVHPLEALLLAKLDAVVGVLLPCLPVLAGRVAAPFERALLGVAAVTLEKQLQAFPAAKPAF